MLKSSKTIPQKLIFIATCLYHACSERANSWPMVLLLSAFSRRTATSHCAFLGPEQYTCNAIDAKGSITPDVTLKNVSLAKP